MSKFFRIATTVLLIAYPLLVWWLAKHGYILLLFALLAGILLVQIASLGIRNPRSFFALSALVVIALVAWLTDPLTGVLYYPVWVSTAMFFVFAISLLHPPAIITRFARVMDGDLSPAAVRYTEGVTLVWALFFVGNGAVAWWTVQTDDMAIWTLYNGFISYVLIGVLMVVEWSIRRVVKHRH